MKIYNVDPIYPYNFYAPKKFHSNKHNYIYQIKQISKESEKPKYL